MGAAFPADVVERSAFHVSSLVSAYVSARTATIGVARSAGFHPSPVSAARACVHRIAASSLLMVISAPAGALELAPGAPTWAPVSTADVARRFASAETRSVSFCVVSQVATCSSALTTWNVVDCAGHIGSPACAT